MASDNGKTFKSAAKTFNIDCSTPCDVQRYFAGIRMEWSFNVAKAPWCVCVCVCVCVWGGGGGNI